MAHTWIEPPAPWGFTPWGTTQWLKAELQRGGYVVLEHRGVSGIDGKGISRLEIRGQAEDQADSSS